MLESIHANGITLISFLLSTGVSLLLGLGTAFVGSYRSRCSQSCALALAILPAAVQLVILLVNGNIGAGVAVAGAFSLVRFRSAPGSAKEISAIFLAMTIGLATGMGYLAIAALGFAVIGGAMLILTALGFGESGSTQRSLKITIPENLDYDGIFDDILNRYTKSWELEKVKTVNMGSLYELHYRIQLKEDKIPKTFLDELRCRNGNLNIACGRELSKESL